MKNYLTVSKLNILADSRFRVEIASRRVIGHRDLFAAVHALGVWTSGTSCDSEANFLTIFPNNLQNIENLKTLKTHFIVSVG